jgi:hypothetical protein
MQSLAVDPDRDGSQYGPDDHRGVAAMEFAIIAPIMVLMIWGVWDISRALLAWEETYHAAEAIAQAAEKLSYTGISYPNTNNPVTALTAQQMQDAMSSIYAEMPWLNLGNPGGLFTGGYQVTLSGVSFNQLGLPGAPPCTPPQATCLTQSPVVLWSSYLTEGGPQLTLPPVNQPNALYRLCTPNPVPVAQFPNNAHQLQDMIDPNLQTGGSSNMILMPQVVADVVFTFQPSFPLLSNLTYTFYASASFPAPVGNDNQQIVFDQKDSGANTVENCPLGNPYNG